MTTTRNNYFGPVLTIAIWFSAFAWVMTKFA